MIGIFDSGSGGLTVMRAIRERLPSADIVYFGDIAHAPYGSRSHDDLSRLTVRAIERLKGYGATSIVSACNSVSAALAVSLFDTLAMEPHALIEMVGPTVSSFKHSDARVLVLATPATVRSELYQNGFRMLGKNATVVAVPELAGAIEFGASPADVERLVSEALATVDLADYDALVLGCTHYPLAYDSFRKLTDARITVVDPAYAVAERVARRFWPREVGDGRTRFIISKESELFRAQVERFFPSQKDAIEVSDAK